MMASKSKTLTGLFERFRKQPENRFDELVGISLGVWGGSFVPRYALVSQKAFVGLAIHQGTAFLTDRVISGRFDHGDFVLRSAVAFMRSGEPFYEFGHARNMRPESVGFQPVGLPQSN
jgi:hypothetical protein